MFENDDFFVGVNGVCVRVCGLWCLDLQQDGPSDPSDYRWMDKSRLMDGWRVASKQASRPASERAKRWNGRVV